MTNDRHLALIEKALGDCLEGTRPASLYAAMRHAVGAGGKRLRPLICLAAAEAVGGRAEDALAPACAIELLHNYTLIHDDLPAMDNDVERRGKPSVWAAFGEALAILAGDALQALAFRVAAGAPRNAGRIVAALGEKGVGVVRGQVEDVAGSPFDVDFVTRHKTADLFIAAAAMGALAAGGSEADVAALGTFAENLGIAFQFEDDLLDRDFRLSESETVARVRRHTDLALEALKGVSGDTRPLQDIAERLVGRKV